MRAAGRRCFRRRAGRAHPRSQRKWPARRVRPCRAGMPRAGRDDGRCGVWRCSGKRPPDRCESRCSRFPWRHPGKWLPFPEGLNVFELSSDDCVEEPQLTDGDMARQLGRAHAFGARLVALFADRHGREDLLRDGLLGLGLRKQEIEKESGLAGLHSVHLRK